MSLFYKYVSVETHQLATRKHMKAYIRKAENQFVSDYSSSETISTINITDRHLLWAPT